MIRDAKCSHSASGCVCFWRGVKRERDRIVRRLQRHAARSRREGDLVGRISADLFTGIVNELNAIRPRPRKRGRS